MLHPIQPPILGHTEFNIQQNLSQRCWMPEQLGGVVMYQLGVTQLLKF